MDASPVSPVAAPVPGTDPMRRLWGPVTIRCAWELLLLGQAPRGAILRQTREHAFRLLPEKPGSAEAEAWTSLAVRDFLARTRGEYAPIVPDPDLAILPDPRWRDAIGAFADPVHDVVWRLHYADGLVIEDVEARTGIDRSLLRAAAEALRGLAREVLIEDGVPVHDWDPVRLDRLIQRIATAAGDQCPGPGGLVTEPGRAHAADCPRCSRAMRLLREGMLSPSDLFPPEDVPVVPPGRVDLMAIELQAEARRHRTALLHALGPGAIAVSGGGWLVDVDATPGLEDRLRALAEAGTPPVDTLRIARRPVNARVVGGVVLGGDVLHLLASLRSLAWGESRGIAALPAPLPPPPSAARWWMTAVVLGLIAGAVGTATLLPGHAPANVELSAQAIPTGLRFDTDDAAFVDVVALRGDHLSVAFHSASSGDKGGLATGDGRFALDVEGDAFFVVARATELDDMERLVDGFSGGEASEVRERLRDRFPGAAVELVYPR